VAGRIQAENIGKMKCAFFLPLLLLSCSALGQLMQYDYGYEKKIQIRLLNEKVIGHESGFSFKVSITNKTDTSFILYDFTNVEAGGQSKGWYMEPNRTVGSALFIFDKNRRSVSQELSDDLLDRYEKQNKPVPFDSIENRTVRNKIIVLAKSTTECVVHIIPRKDRRGEIRDRLEKGEYKMSFLYYCGWHIPNVVKKEHIEEDERKHNAMVYQGYTESNTVKLIVR